MKHLFSYHPVRVNPTNVKSNPAKLAQSDSFDSTSATLVDAQDQVILDQIRAFTMTSTERQLALIDAVRYIVRRGIPGDFVECGVWRGGSSMATAIALQQEGDTTRRLFLFDTFDGMTAPTSVDISHDGIPADIQLERDVDKKDVWCKADFDEVESNMRSTGYPCEKIHLVKGPVEQTIPSTSLPQPIAFLRLDTDWYESTRHELIHLFPQVTTGGVVLVDDYGHWQGARKAVDDYLAAQPLPYLMFRIDYTGRMLLKS